MKFWLIRSPYKRRNWDDVLVRASFQLYGVRSPEARNNIRQMQPGDQVVYYHGPSGRALFGIMTVSKPAYPDPTSANTDWLAIDFVPDITFATPVKLSSLRKIEALADSPLLTRPRLTVAKISAKLFKLICGEGL
jgi:predicted RNA-binding protein with PUA-like domain